MGPLGVRRPYGSGVPAPAGYHHLGAGTTGGWAGLSGRMTVRDAGVRPGTWDFVATRFMAKRTDGAEVTWLEVGWAETGWAGDGRQRIYTYDTGRRAWRFYDDYRLRDGERIWLALHADADGGWRAWLWWGDRWNLLTDEPVRLGPAAQLEQYVETHVDAARPAPLRVPPIDVDNVQVRDPADGSLRYWRAQQVPSAGTDPTAGPDRGYCLHWRTRYDTWSAGDCPTAPS